MKTLRVPTTNGRVDVEVRSTYKYLCVHAAVRRYGYSVTHAATGMCVLHADNLRLAREAAKLLDVIPGWDVTTNENADAFYLSVKPFFDAIRKYAQGESPKPDPYEIWRLTQ